MQLRIIIFSIFITAGWSSHAQTLGFNFVLNKYGDVISPFAIPNTPENLNELKINGCQIKYSNANWIYFNAKPQELSPAVERGELKGLYFEYYPPTALNDTARAHHYVDSVHIGTGGLDRPYRGKDVIIGVIDSGIEVNHPDFMDSSGRTKILRYWDHSIAPGPYSPQPYGYGYVWDSTQINNGLCTSTDASTHGSTVAGIAAGSGMANGTNYGMSPDADLIIVETNFSLPSWTLTIADACDFIFKVADTLGKPAVINLSVGSYFGSHDGNDPAADYIESLLDEKNGRLVVAAAGNSGEGGKYHVHNEIDSDTSFTWFYKNPTGYFANNSVFFDLWSDTNMMNWDYFIAVDRPIPNLSEAGRSSIYSTQSNLGSSINQSITNANGDVLCIMEAYPSVQYGAYHLQILLTNCDSTGNYLFRFGTTGTGNYDLWSGTFSNMNDIHEIPLSEVLYPNIIHYAYPDTLQTIVNSWNCSEKVVSVGNMKNRQSFVAFDLSSYNSGPVPAGQLSPSSSKGPNRHNVIKPDVAAAGEISLSASTLSFLSQPANYYKIDSAGWHSLNGGTSMAAPAVAGIGGLYLERCKLSNYQDFINDLHNTSYSDQYTGVLPNNAFGYGKVHALDLMLGMDLGPLPIITVTGSMQISSSDALTYQWYLNGQQMTNENSQDLIVYETTGTYEVEITNYKGCTLLSDPVIITLGLHEMDQNHSIYPNPSKDIIAVEADDDVVEIQILDMHGKPVAINSLGDQKFSISHMNHGAYIVIVKTENGISRSKLVKL